METYRERYHKLGSLLSAANNMVMLLQAQIKELEEGIPEKDRQAITKNSGTLRRLLIEIDQQINSIKSVSYRFIDPDKPLREIENEMRAENSQFKVLVVDDLEGVREAHAQSLEKRGFRVSAAANVVAAINTVKASSPDIVILELALPDDMEGLEVLAYIRQNKLPTKCIIVTREDSPEKLDRVRRAGADKVLSKPIDIELLVAQINSLVNKS